MLWSVVLDGGFDDRLERCVLITLIVLHTHTTLGGREENMVSLRMDWNDIKDEDVRRCQIA